MSLLSRLFFVCCSVAVLAACGAEKKMSLTAGDEGYIRFPTERVYWEGKKIDLTGSLSFPEGATGKVPAMVIMHGSAGQGYRDASWSDFFLDHGIATFRVDYYATRGLTRGGRGGPKNPYDLTDAIKFLKTHPRIDATKIGTMGFSRGGSIVMATLQMNAREFGGNKPVLNVNMYGNCINGVDKGTTDAPVVVIVGDKDDLQPSTLCEGLGENAKRFDKDFRIHVIPGATHAFDDNKGGTIQWGGQTVTISPSGQATAEARRIVLAALNETLKK